EEASVINNALGTQAVKSLAQVTVVRVPVQPGVRLKARTRVLLGIRIKQSLGSLESHLTVRDAGMVNLTNVRAKRPTRPGKLGIPMRYEINNGGGVTQLSRQLVPGGGGSPIGSQDNNHLSRLRGMPGNVSAHHKQLIVLMSHHKNIRGVGSLGLHGKANRKQRGGENRQDNLTHHSSIRNGSDVPW